MTTVKNLKDLIAESGKANTKNKIDFLALYFYGYGLGLYRTKLLEVEIELSNGRVVFGKDYCKSPEDLSASDLFMLRHIILRHSDWQEEDFISELRRWGFRDGERLTDEKIAEIFFHGLTNLGTDEEEEKMFNSAKVEVPVEIIRSVVRGEE